MHIIGKLLFTGRTSYPIMLRVASSMAAKTNHILVHHLKILLTQVKYLKDIAVPLRFNKPISKDPFFFDVHSDSSMRNKKETSLKGGFILFRRCGDIVHSIFWPSRKLLRSSKLPVFRNNCSRRFHDKSQYLAILAKELMYVHEIEYTTDSSSSFSLVSNKKYPQESLNKVDLLQCEPLSSMELCENHSEFQVITMSWFPYQRQPQLVLF